MSNFDDVEDFHKKFDFLNAKIPRHLTNRKLKERIEFLTEELIEFIKGCGYSSGSISFDHERDPQVSLCSASTQDLSEQADALIDLVYVAMGTAVMLGLPWQDLWDDVQRANMVKERGIGKRGHPVDCVKPENWVGPQTIEILLMNGYDKDAEEVGDAFT